MRRDVKITGGAGPLEAAAIAAVVQQVLSEELPNGEQHDRHLDEWVLSLRQDLDPRPRLRR